MANRDNREGQEADQATGLIEPKVVQVPEDLEAEVVAAKAILSAGFAHCRTDKPFEAYRYSGGNAPFQFMPLRERGPSVKSPAISLKPLDFIRMEVPTCGYELEIVAGRSDTGWTDEQMFPTQRSGDLCGQALEHE